MILSVPISNFNSILEILVVFNITYVSIDGVKQFVNCKIFGLADRQTILFSKIDVLIVDIETELNNRPDKELEARYITSKGALLSLRKKIPVKIEKIQTLFRYIYLIGGIFTLSLLFLGGFEQDEPNLIMINTLSILTFVTLIVLSSLGMRLKFPRNIMFLTILLYIILVIVSVLFSILEIKIFNFLPMECILIIPLVPFIFNYLGTLYLYRLLKIDFNRIENAIENPYNNDVFLIRLHHLLEEPTNPKELTIEEGSYGANDIFKDVTSELTKLIKANTINYSGKYETVFGDPIKGTPKVLIIKYKYSGRINKSIFNEDSPIKLPIIT